MRTVALVHLKVLLLHSFLGEYLALFLQSFPVVARFVELYLKSVLRVLQTDFGHLIPLLQSRDIVSYTYHWSHQVLFLMREYDFLMYQSWKKMTVQ